MELTILQAILLGLVQGLTEFLPVSSSGHLVIAQTLLGIDEEMLDFDVFVHVGTLIAVFATFWQDIVALLKRPFCRFTGLIIVACIPAGLMGIFLNDFFSSLFSSIIAVACALIVTGIFLMLSDRLNGHKTVNEMGVGSALVIGIFQGVAITPGLSRSGSTIFGALLMGLKRSEAAKFSFIVSIPVILGAALLQVLDLVDAGESILTLPYVIGALVAAGSGYLAIRIFLRLLEKRSMRYFSYYVWTVALIVLIRSIFF